MAMIAAVGHVALVSALALAVALACVAFAAAARGDAARGDAVRGDAVRASALPRRMAIAQAAAVLIAFGCLALAFVRADFSIASVAAHAERAMSPAWRFTALWAGHEGSLLLWLAALATWTLAYAWRMATIVGANDGARQAGFDSADARARDALGSPTAARVLGVLGLVSAGLLAVMLGAADPFAATLPSVPADGAGLNALLQDTGMAVHPPLLFAGYAGLALPFAFGIAALLEGRADRAWARALRPWVAAAWCALTLGIALGSQWAYRELGWGGWWFWDPVENASFMPWLLATALLHALAATDRRGALPAASVLLALAAFALALLGTFITRAGVLSSLHAFASDTRRGAALLMLLAAVVGGALALYALRAPRLARTGGARFAVLSRESLLAANNLLLAAAAAAVLLGTLWPLVSSALGLGTAAVGPRYFETVLLPVMALAATLLGLGPLARWSHDRPAALRGRLRGAAWVAIAIAAAGAIGAERLDATSVLGLLLAGWIVAATLLDFRRKLAATALCTSNLRGRLVASNGVAHIERAAAVSNGSRLVASLAVLSEHIGGIPGRLARLPRGTAGVALAHLGVAVFAFGLSMGRSGEAPREVALAPGDAVEVAGYRFAFAGARPLHAATFDAAQALVEVTTIDDGRLVAQLLPEKRLYHRRGQVTTEAAINAGLARDLYVSLGQPLPEGAWTVRVQVKPFIACLWGGCVLMALGGACAAVSRRRRAVRGSATAAAPALLPAPAALPGTAAHEVWAGDSREAWQQRS